MLSIRDEALIGDLFGYGFKVSQIHDEDWGVFWVSDVRTAAVPRTAIRGLVDYHQLAFRITHGNMNDANHALNLIGNDLFITCDTNFYNVLQKVVASVNTKLAAPAFVDRNTKNACEEIISVISNHLK